MMAEWSTLALYWYAPTTAGIADPVFGRPISFYLFALPVWQLISGWVLTLAVILCAVAAFFLFVSGGGRLLTRRRGFDPLATHWRGMSIVFAVLILQGEPIPNLGLILATISATIHAGKTPSPTSSR